MPVNEGKWDRLMITGITGFCGLYTLLGIRTCPVKK